MAYGLTLYIDQSIYESTSSYMNAGTLGDLIGYNVWLVIYKIVNYLAVASFKTSLSPSLRPDYRLLLIDVAVDY